jgi:hypothetical protein
MAMGKVLPLPLRGETFLDPRGEGRSLRVSGHPDSGTVVLSVWRHSECQGTFRVASGEIDALVRALLSAAPPTAPVPTAPHGVGPTAPASEDEGKAQTVDETLAAATAEPDENPAAATG